MLAGTVVVVGAGVVSGVGALDVVAVVGVVLALLKLLVFCMFAMLWGCPPKSMCLPKVPKLP